MSGSDNKVRTVSLRTHRTPAWVRSINGFGRLMGWRAGLSAEAIQEAARRTVRSELGRVDFLDQSFQKPLDVLCQSADQEARLHPLGRAITRIRMRNVLANRLRLEAALKRYPAILDEPVAAPIVVAGLQRTGTTFLHRLLAAVPGLRTLASWEALQPIPQGGRWPKDAGHRPLDPAPAPDPQRLRAARQAEKALQWVSPDFFAIHPVEHDAPEEDVLLLDNALLSTVPEATMHVPAYAAWLEQQDHEPAYRHLRVMLQALQFFGGRGRWVLKSPHHLEHLAVIRKVFPDALIVQTHRDPAVTYASFFSMVWHGRRVFSDRVPPEEVAAHWRRKNKLMLDRAMAVRADTVDQHCLDLAYHELIADPPAAVHRILEASGMAFDPATAVAVKAAVAAQAPHRYGRHVYDWVDFGLSAETLAPDWQAYRKRFADYLETPANHG